MSSIRQKLSIRRKPEETTDWTSIYIASSLSFVGSTQFSLYFSSLWPYLQLLDQNATPSFFGFIIAIYSLGQIISAPLFGYWSNRIEQVKLPLMVGVTLMFFGNVFFLNLGIVGFPRYLMLIGRFITGMGSGNTALLRAYASTASTFKDRPRAIALVTCGQAIGNTAGPAFQLLFTPLGYPGFQILPGMSLDMYTAPAYFACAMNFFGLVALYFLFKESYVGIVNKPNAITGKSIKLPKYDMVAVFVCYMTRFTQMFVNTNLETLGSPISMMMFNWQESTAVTFTSIAQGILGALTFVVYLIYIFFNIENYLTNFRIGCISSLILFMSFFMITYSWPFLPAYTFIKDITISNSPNSTANLNVGCNVQQYSWCTSLNQVNVWVYYMTYVVTISLAYAFNNIMLSTLFSRILGPRRQGTQQGILQNSGNIARMMGPIVISSLYTSSGPRMVWMIDAAVVLVTMLFWVVFYNRMVPLKDQSTFEPNFCSNVEKKVHVGATTFYFGSKFQFDNPEEIFDIQNCIKILNVFEY